MGHLKEKSQCVHSEVTFATQVLLKDVRSVILLICRLVKGILGFYYKSDAEVSQDSELQTWIEDIFEHGFLSQQCTGGTHLLLRSILMSKLMCIFSILFHVGVISVASHYQALSFCVVFAGCQFGLSLS